MKDDQSEKLRTLFEHARRSTAYYANHLPNLSSALPVETVELVNLVAPLSRKQLQREKIRLYSVASDTSSWRVARTTGTTGEPAEVVLDSRARRVEAEIIADHFDQLPISDSWRQRDMMHLVLHAGATSRSIPTPWSSTARITKWNLIRAWQASDAQFFKSLQFLNGNLVTTMPSVAELLCSRIQRAGASGSIRPLLVLLSGEAVEPEIQAQVAKVFDCIVPSLYVITEAGIVGRGCPDRGGYHEAQQNVFLEIVDADGKATPSGVEGEILVTPLENYAMPLLRYRTGDRGQWETEHCTCGNTGTRLTLTTVRRPVHLAETSGVSVNIVRFAKLFASLELQRYGFSQGRDGSVTVSYAAKRQLDVASRSLIVSTVRSVVGLDARVHLRHVLSADAVMQGDQASRPVSIPRDERKFEPGGLDAKPIQKWLKQKLTGSDLIECAVLTGSALDVEATTRFSDVDLVILIHDEPNNPHWIELCRELRMHLPTLSVNVDQVVGLSQRAPLTVCRLLTERLPVIGNLNTTLLPWPSKDDLKVQGRLWAQEAFAVLWHRLTSPVKVNDPVHEAWTASKFGLNALRYHYLARGERTTSAREIIARALQDRESMPWLDELIESFETARELRPPPVPTTENVRRYFAAALSSVRFVSEAFRLPIRDRAPKKVNA